MQYVELAKFSMDSLPREINPSTWASKKHLGNWFRTKLGLTKRKRTTSPSVFRRFDSEFIVWLTCHEKPRSKLALYLAFDDEMGQHRFHLDSQELNFGHSVMFSGEAAFQVVSGEPIVRLECQGLEADASFKLDAFEVREALSSSRRGQLL